MLSVPLSRLAWALIKLLFDMSFITACRHLSKVTTKKLVELVVMASNRSASSIMLVSLTGWLDCGKLTRLVDGDTHLIQRLIESGEGTQAQKDRNRDNLRGVVQYCMNTTDCRRTQILQYFGENFDSKLPLIFR